MKKNALLALILTLALLASLLAGCGSTSETTSTDSAQDTESAAAESPEETAEEDETAEETPAEEAAQTETAETEAAPEETAAEETTEEETTEEETAEEEPAPEESAEESAQPILVGDVECATQNGNPFDVQAETVSLPMTEDEDEITIWMGIYPDALNYITDLDESSLVWSTIKERTGINVQLEVYHPANGATQLALMEVSGDFYDVLDGVAAQYTGGYDAAINDGAYVDLKEWLPEYAPNLWNMITYSADSYEYCLTTEGHVAALRMMTYPQVESTNGMVIRGDWLEQLGLETPTTVDELHDVLTAFKTIQSDTSMYIQSNTLGCLNFAFGVSTEEMAVDEDGQIYYTYTSEQYGEYLELLAQWYSEGLIWEDFASYTDSSGGTKTYLEDMSVISSGKVSVFRTETTKVGELESQYEMQFVPMVYPVMEDGDYMTLLETSENPYFEQNQITVTTNCQRVDLVCMLYEYIYTKEGQELTNYGIEGETFNYDENGDPVYTDFILNPTEYSTQVAQNVHLFEKTAYVRDSYRDEAGYSEVQKSCSEVWNSTSGDNSGRISANFSLSGDDSTEYSTIMSDIQTHVDEMICKFVMGLRPLEEYDDFVQECYDMGLQEAIDIYQAAYDAYEE